jgi:hypothetical protein
MTNPLKVLLFVFILAIAGVFIYNQFIAIASIGRAERGLKP